MPKLKQKPHVRADNELVGKIHYAFKVYDLTIDELAAACCMSRSTFYNRLRDPGEFTKRELEKLRAKLHIDKKDFMEFFA